MSPSCARKCRRPTDARTSRAEVGPEKPQKRLVENLWLLLNVSRRWVGLGVKLSRHQIITGNSNQVVHDTRKDESQRRNPRSATSAKFAFYWPSLRCCHCSRRDPMLSGNAMEELRKRLQSLIRYMASYRGGRAATRWRLLSKMTSNLITRDVIIKGQQHRFKKFPSGTRQRH